MEKANNMMTDNDMMCWHALYTAPKSEHKLMQRLNAAGYTTYCPMQAVFVKWKGHTRKVITPLFSGCLFVAGNVAEVASLASSQKASLCTMLLVKQALELLEYFLLNRSVWLEVIRFFHFLQCFLLILAQRFGYIYADIYQQISRAVPVHAG